MTCLNSVNKLILLALAIWGSSGSANITFPDKICVTQDLREATPYNIIFGKYSLNKSYTSGDKFIYQNDRLMHSANQIQFIWYENEWILTDDLANPSKTWGSCQSSTMIDTIVDCPLFFPELDLPDDNIVIRIDDSQTRCYREWSDNGEGEPDCIIVNNVTVSNGVMAESTFEKVLTNTQYFWQSSNNEYIFYNRIFRAWVYSHVMHTTTLSGYYCPDTTVMSPHECEIWYKVDDESITMQSPFEKDKYCDSIATTDWDIEYFDSYQNNTNHILNIVLISVTAISTIIGFVLLYYVCCKKEKKSAQFITKDEKNKDLVDMTTVVNPDNNNTHGVDVATSENNDDDIEIKTKQLKISTDTKNVQAVPTATPVTDDDATPQSSTKWVKFT